MLSKTSPAALAGHRARRVAVTLLAMLALTASSSMAVGSFGAQSAKADEITYINGSGTTGGAEGPRHTLSANTSYYAGGTGVCANARNETDTSWVGVTQCNSILMSIAYCQCALRYPWGATQYGPHFLEAWEDF